MSALTTLETDLDCVGDVCVKDLFWSVSFFLKKCEIIRPENRIFLFVSNRFFLRIFPSRFRSSRARSMDVGSVNATRYARAMMIFFVSYQMIRIQNPNDVARCFDEGKEERERPHFQTPKRLAPLPAKKRTTTKARTWTLVALRPATDAIC